MEILKKKEEVQTLLVVLWLHAYITW